MGHIRGVPYLGVRRKKDKPAHIPKRAQRINHKFEKSNPGGSFLSGVSDDGRRRRRLTTTGGQTTHGRWTTTDDDNIYFRRQQFSPPPSIVAAIMLSYSTPPISYYNSK